MYWTCFIGFFNYRGGSVGVGGGGSNFITYLSIIGIVIMLMGFMVCLISRYYCGKDQEEEDDDARKYGVNVIYF